MAEPAGMVRRAGRQVSFDGSGGRVANRPRLAAMVAPRQSSSADSRTGLASGRLCISNSRVRPASRQARQPLRRCGARQRRTLRNSNPFLRSEKGRRSIRLASICSCGRRTGRLLVMLDLEMPGMSGLGRLRQTLAANCHKPVVLFSGQAPREVVFEALALGAAGFILKSLSARSSLNAVHFVLSVRGFPVRQQLCRCPGGAACGRRADGQTVVGVRDPAAAQGSCWFDQQGNRPRLGLSDATIKMDMSALCSGLKAKNLT